MGERIADLERARDAVDRGSWHEAYDELQTADPARLSARDLEAFADAAWWISRADEALATRQRAYVRYADGKEDPEAALVSIRLCFEHFERGEPAVAMGWLMRAQRHLENEPDCYQQGFLALCRAVVSEHQGDLDTAMTLAQRATEIGQRFDHRELTALGIHGQGLAHISASRVDEGMALLDEAMTAVVAGELTQFFTGVIYCNVLDVCLDLADIGRAAEWNDAALAWCRSLPSESPYPGICRIHRAEVAGFRGDWSEAESESIRASVELAANPMVAARAFYQTGEIRRRLGNLEGAEEAFARAHELGYEPQPGLALLRLAQGKLDAARTALRLASADRSVGPLPRGKMLAAYVEVAVAAGDLEEAGTACSELESIAASFRTPALKATANAARGSLRLAEGDIDGALDALRRAGAVWQQLRLPYEAARARLLYGVATRRAGDEETSRLELRAALSAFERLGAANDARKAAELLSEQGELPGRLTVREAEVLRLVATGKTNREIAVDLVISEHTVARHLQNLFGKLDVSSRAAATAYAFEHGLV